MNKKIIFIAILFGYSTMIYSQTIDSAYLFRQIERIDKVETRTNALQEQSSVLQHDIAGLEQRVNDLAIRLVETDSAISHVDEQYGLQLRETDSTIQNNETKRQKSVMWGIVIAVFLALVSAIVYLLLRIRIAKKSNDIELLRARADDLNRQIVERMDKELEELTKIVTQTTSPTNSSNAEPDHTLVKALADRITFMEMTLYRMDPSVKGHKHLTRSIKQMKDNLLANGYEIVDMLGKEYVEGMKVTSNFVEDENIEEGKRIITGIIKPQINYKGKMIQTAQLTVSQNI